MADFLFFICNINHYLKFKELQQDEVTKVFKGLYLMSFTWKYKAIRKAYMKQLPQVQSNNFPVPSNTHIDPLIKKQCKKSIH